VSSDRPTGRALAVDLGTRRIGLAACDRAGSMAFPHGVIERRGDPASDLEGIVRAAQEVEAETVVVGLPLSLDGSDGPAAVRARAEADQLRAVLAIPVVLFDERLTTVSARASLSAAGRRGKAARSVVDSAAATVLLQAWLDAGRPGG
jgi:putative Holliday junction resolvase